MHSKKTVSFFFAACAALVLNATAHADTKDAKQSTLTQMATNIKDKCGSDIDKFCSGIQPGGGRIAACLESRQNQLSTSCKSTWTATKADVSKRMDKADVAFRKSCGNDLQKFCAEVPSGKGRLLDCLGTHKADLSDSCKNFQTKLDQKLSDFIG